MGGRLSALVSPNPDINENREIGIDLIKECNKTPHQATAGDIAWFWQDLDMPLESDIAWEYVNPRIKELCGMYSFAVTEWFMEFYRYMPEVLDLKLDRTGQIDWNLFFSLAYPLPGGLAVPFHAMINKLNVAQNRIVRKQIIEEIWNNEDLRVKVMKWENIPSIYTYYIAYPIIRNAIERRVQKELKEKRREINQSVEGGRGNRLRQLLPLFQQVLQAQKEGTEVILVKND